MREKGLILKKSRYGESDLIIQLLTTQGERRSFFARAALKSRKRFGGGVLDPLHYVEVSYETKGRSLTEGTLFPLREVQLLRSFEGLKKNYDRLSAGIYFAQMTLRIAREGSQDPQIFNLLGNALKQAEVDDELPRLKMHFDLKLLATQGIVPSTPELLPLLSLPLSARAQLTLEESEARSLRIEIDQLKRRYAEDHSISMNDAPTEL